MKTIKMKLVVVVILLFLFVLNTGVYKIAFSDENPPSPNPPKSGKLILEINSSELIIGIDEKQSAEVTISSEEGKLANVKFKMIPKQDAEFNWIKIEYESNTYNISDEIEIPEIKKGEEKKVSILFNPDESTKLGDYVFYIQAESGEEKKEKNLKVEVVKWGTFLVSLDKKNGEDNPYEVVLDDSCNFSVSLKSKEQNSYLKDLKVSVNFVPTEKNPFNESNIKEYWEFKINDSPYTLGEDFHIKELVNSEEKVRFNIKPKKTKGFDFEDFIYKFNIQFYSKKGKIENGKLSIFIKVIRHRKLKVEFKNLPSEGYKNEPIVFNVSFAAEEGDVGKVSMKITPIQLPPDVDINKASVISYKGKEYEFEKEMKLFDEIKEGESINIDFSIKFLESAKTGKYRFKIDIFGDFESIEINPENQEISFELKEKEKPGKLIIKIDKKEEEKAINIAKEKEVTFTLRCLAEDGFVKNVELKIEDLPSDKIKYEFSENGFNLKKEESKVVKLTLILDNKIEIDEYTFKITGNYNNNEEIDTKSIKLKVYKEIILNLIIGSKTMYVNDEPVDIDVPPTIIEGRTLLPIRWIAEPLGADVGWDGTERKVTVTLNDTTIELWIGKSIARVNDNYQFIDPDNPNVRPLIIKGRTMIPVRFVAENFGCKVDWDGATRTVIIIYKEEP